MSITRHFVFYLKVCGGVDKKKIIVLAEHRYDICLVAVFSIRSFFARFRLRKIRSVSQTVAKTNSTPGNELSLGPKLVNILHLF